MVRLAICDDQPEHLRYTALLVRRELNSYILEIDSFSSAGQFLNCLKVGDYTPDIAVLDVELGPASGIDIAKELNRLLPSCRIIFLTGHAEYVSASYEAEHTWFVLKSQADAWFGQALRRAISSSPSGESALGIVAKSGGKSFFLPLGEVLYIDRVARRTRIVCREESYYVSGPPTKLVTEALASSFVRCHQGFWVNLRNVRGLEREEFVLSDETRIPIGRTYRAQARERFFARFSEAEASAGHAK